MRKAILQLLLGFSLAAVAPLARGADTSSMPKVGEKAPAVVAQDQNGHTWRLADEVGKEAVLLYFYPKDDTPGCTKEACGLRDRMSDLTNDHVQVLGVSFDPANSHQKFIEKYHLNFPLLVDTDGKIADTYGVRMAGRNMARRVSFLIDRQGIIRHVTDNPSADVHLAEMQKAIKGLQKD